MLSWHAEGRLYLWQKPYRIMRMKMVTTQDKTKPNAENIRRFNMAAVRHMTVQVMELSIQEMLCNTGTLCCAKPGLMQALYIQ
jgi:hypothetical protein